MRVLFLLLASATALQLRQSAELNPITKIVKVLQKMQGELQEEGRQDEKMYEKYFCYCKNGAAQLAADLANSSEETKRLQADIDAGTAREAQLKQDVEDARKRRAEAKQAIAEATAIRKKEKDAFDALSADMGENTKALDAAMAAIRKGMGQAFLQSTMKKEALKHAVDASNGVMDMEKEEVLSFIANPFGDYAAQSGEITGVLSQMLDRMNADWADAKKAEADAVATFKELMAAKSEEVALATKEIETKIEKAGQVAVETAQKKGQLSETGRSMEADRGFLADLDKNCKDQEASYQERVKSRNEELSAVSEAVKILNDDDARDIFKKATPGQTGSSFLQRDDSRQQAVELMEAATEAASARHRPQLSLLTTMIRTGKVDFGKVIKMINDMRGLLKKEQSDDDESLSYCNKELKAAADNKAEFERNIKALEADIEALGARIEELKADNEELARRISETNSLMKESTETRKEENAAYTENMATAQASIQLMGKARNFLNKVYNKAAYKKATERQMTEEEQILVNSGGTLETQAPEYIRGTNILKADYLQTKPGPAPETASYERKTGAGTGVIKLISNMIGETETSMRQMELEENEAQKDYEELMTKSKASVAADTEATTQNNASIAESDTNKNQAEQDLAAKKDELAKEIETIGGLHADCDFLIANFDTRKQARADEDDSLSRAVSILQGAKGEDFGF